MNTLFNYLEAHQQWVFPIIHETLPYMFVLAFILMFISVGVVASQKSAS